jgi:hypothetical protein
LGIGVGDLLGGFVAYLDAFVGEEAVVDERYDGVEGVGDGGVVLG